MVIEFKFDFGFEISNRFPTSAGHLAIGRAGRRLGTSVLAHEDCSSVTPLDGATTIADDESTCCHLDSQVAQIILDLNTSSQTHYTAAIKILNGGDEIADDLSTTEKFMDLSATGTSIVQDAHLQTMCEPSGSDDLFDGGSLQEYLSDYLYGAGGTSVVARSHATCKGWNYFRPPFSKLCDTTTGSTTSATYFAFFDFLRRKDWVKKIVIDNEQIDSNANLVQAACENSANDAAHRASVDTILRYYVMTDAVQQATLRYPSASCRKEFNPHDNYFNFKNSQFPAVFFQQV